MGGVEKILSLQMIVMQDTIPHSVPQMQPVPEETDAGNSEWARQETVLQVGRAVLFNSSCNILSYFQTLLWAQVCPYGM